MSDKKATDPKAAQTAFNQLLRDSHSAGCVHWVPSTSLDPAVRAQDRADLNDALRKAGGHQPQHEDVDPEPQTFPWKSLGDDAV